MNLRGISLRRRTQSVLVRSGVSKYGLGAGHYLPVLLYQLKLGSFMYLYHLLGILATPKAKPIAALQLLRMSGGYGWCTASPTPGKPGYIKTKKETDSN